MKSRLLKYMTIALTVLPSGGCGHDTDSPSTDTEHVFLQLHLSPGNSPSLTRTDLDPNHFETTASEEHESEIGIWEDICDYRIYMYDLNSGILIFDSGNNELAASRNYAINIGSQGEYVVTLELPYFYNTGTHRIQTIVMANLEGAFGEYPSANNASISLSDPINPTFSLYDNGREWELGKVFDNPRRKCLIPMYGEKTSTVESADAEDGKQITLDLGSIRLLRALAKFEVIDMLRDVGNKSVYPQILNVKLSGIPMTGYLRPDGYSTAETGELIQVEQPTPYTATDSETGAFSFYGDRSMKFDVPDPGDPDKTMSRELNYFTGYTPEMDEEMLKNPKLEITYQLNATDEPETAYINLNTLQNKTPVYAHILRNHIYRIMVERQPEDATVAIRWTVCEWDVRSADIPTFK